MIRNVIQFKHIKVQLYLTVTPSPHLRQWKPVMLKSMTMQHTVKKKRGEKSCYKIYWTWR